MKRLTILKTSAGFGATAIAVALLTAPANAQEASPATPEVAPTPTPVAEPAPVPQPSEAAPLEVAPEPMPPTPAPPEVAAPEMPMAEPPPEEPEPEPETTFPSSLKVGIGLRTGLALTFNAPASDGPELSLHDGLDGLGTALNVRPYFSGSLTEDISFTFNIETFQGSVQVLDAIAQIKVADEFQIWVGQHIPAMERNNFNGPFYHNGWNLPITAHTLPFDIAARDRGVTFWGLVGGGVFKYHASIVDLAPGAASMIGDEETEAAGLANARVALRATVNLLDPENYYYTSGTYYGSQDTLAIGAVFQYQRGVDAVDEDVDLDNDLVAFTADLLFEKVFAGSGTLTINGAYWNLEGVGEDYAPNQGTTQFGSGVAAPAGSSFLAGVSWLLETKTGIGQLQPNVTVQSVLDDGPLVVDAGLGYIIDGFNHRWFLNYRYRDPSGDADAISMLQLGAQLQL